MAKSLKVKPSDLTRIAARNGGTFPLMRIERIISGEEQPPTGHGTSEMPVWGPIFSHVERDQDLGRVRIDNLRAHELYLQQGNQSGTELDDWLQAEEEILRAHNDALVDEASEESFPESDSPAYSVQSSFASPF